MDREGFRNRLKQYKEARGLNPLLKYWDWRLRYEVSTEENPIYYNELEDLNNQLSEIEPLLNERKNIEQALINKRLELSKKHKVPYLKDKEIILTNAGSMTGARLTTNLLDSIAKYANKTGLPLQEAVGLAALETTFGQNIRLFNKIRNNSNYDDYCVEDILSDWRYKSKDVNEYLEKKLNAPSAEAARLQKESFDYTMSKTHRMSAEEYEKAIILGKRALLLRAKDLIDFIINNYNDFEKAWTDYEEKTVSPFEHAFEYYKTGKYNPADSTHTDMVKLKGEEVMLSPEFKNWLKQYKDIPKYGDGTDLIGKKEIQWFKDWYNKRVEYAIANNRPDIIKQLESLLYDFYPKLYKYSLGVDWDDSIYTGTLDPRINDTKISINDKAIKDYEKKHGVKIGGYLHPSEGIVLPSNYNSNDLLHELAHTFNQTGSITNAVNSAISDENGFVTIPEGLQNPEYWISPWEVHSRLMQFREENNIDPTKVYNEEDIKQLRKSAKDKILFEIFNDSQMIHLLNDVADNATTSTDDRLFLKNGGVVPKYYGGTNFVTYDPDELQRNIQRVLHTTPEGEVNPFYNSLDDTYGSVKLPEITVTAPYTRKASLAQQARLGREAYYKAGQKAAPVLAAIPLGAGILGAASMFGFGPVLDILDVASDPTNLLSYVDKFDLSKIKVGPSRAEKLGRFLENEPIGQPVNVQLSPKTSTYVPSKDHAKTSLKFFERPSKLTQEELDGLSKHYRDRSKHSEKYGTDFGEYDIRTQRSDSPIFSEFVGDGSESAVFSSKNNKWVYKIYDGASFNDLDELRKWTNNFLLRNKIDFAEPITYKGFVTSKLGIHPVFRQKKLTPIPLNDPKAIDILNKIREMYKNAGWDDRMIKDGLQLNDMQIQNFAYDKLGNLKAIDVDVYPVNGLADGGEVGDNTDYRQQIINRADYVASNYDDAKDFDLNPLVYTFRKFAKDNFDRGGISNCTLSATGWIDPNNQYMSAKNIFNNPSSGYTEIDAGYALPGDLLIAKNPEKNSYHTMLIEGFNGNEPILRYSRGGHDTKENLVTGRPLAEYHELDNKQDGNHTEDHYFRYNIPNEYWLPELIVTPNKR